MRLNLSINAFVYLQQQEDLLFGSIVQEILTNLTAFVRLYVPNYYSYYEISM